MTDSRRLRKVSGFSLVELIVVAGAVSIVAAGTTALVLNMTRQSQSLMAKSQFGDLVALAQAALNSPDSCQNVLAAVRLPQSNYDSLNSNNPAAFELNPGFSIGGAQGVLYQAGQSFGTNARFTKVQFTKLRPAPSGRSGEHVATLLLEAARTSDNKSLGAPLQFSIDLLLGFVDDSSTTPPRKKISGCFGRFDTVWANATMNAADLSNYGELPGKKGIIYTGWVSINKPIATGNPTAALDVTGVAQADAFVYSSDRRLKENIRDIPSALDRVRDLHGVIFDWKDPARAGASNRDQIGLIAQEVEQVFPEAVATNPSTGIKSVAYGNLIAPLIEAIKAQQNMIESQRKEIETLRRSVRALEKNQNAR